MVVQTRRLLSGPLKWHGGKQPLASWIHSLAPFSREAVHGGYTHRNIVFGGGLGEFWDWEPIDGISEAVNDTNEDLYIFYKVLRDEEMFKQFQRAAELTPFSDAAFAINCKVNQGSGVNWVARAYSFFVKIRQSRQGLGKCFATPTRRTRRGMNENVSAWLSAVDGLPEVHERLRRVEICNQDFAEFISKRDHAKAFFYLDPPYLHSTRSTTGEYGEHEMSEEQHKKLLAQLRSISGKFMLSGYHSDLYDAWASASGWICHEKRVDNHASSAKIKERKIECIWTNYYKR